MMTFSYRFPRMIFLFLLTIPLLYLPASPVFQTAHAAGKVVIANGDWAPYQGKDLPGGGPASIIVTEAFATQGLDVEFRYMPWARGLNLTREAQTDATMLYSYNEERGQSFLYSDAIISLDTVVFHLKDKKFHWENPEDLKGMTLGAVLEYDYGFVREDSGYTLDRVASGEFNYRKLAAGRIDALMEERLVGLETARQEGLGDRITYHAKPIKSVPYHLIVSKENPRAEEIIQTFNKGLSQLKADGRLNQILQITP